MSENSTIYVNGIRTFPKKDNSPEWILGNGVITPRELIDFLKSPEALDNMTEYKGQKQLPVTFVANRGGGFSIKVNNYKPKAEVEVQSDQEDDSDLPF